MVLLTVYIRAIVDTSRIILIMYDVLLGEGGVYNIHVYNMLQDYPEFILKLKFICIHY